MGFPGPGYLGKRATRGAFAMPTTVIVVPCFNEAVRLDADALRAFAGENPAVRLLFVNDGSTDGTGEIIDAFARSDPHHFSALHLPNNMGKAEAVRVGLLRAFALGPEYAGYWDADLATPLDVIHTFRAVLDSRPDIAMVFGARVSLLGRSVERHPLRHYLGRIFATAASAALGVRFYDTQCGAKLFRVSPEITSLFQAPFRTRWLFDVEILARVIAAPREPGRPRVEEIVYEYPLHEWRDVTGSKVRPRDFLAAFFELAAIRWCYLGPNRADVRSQPRPPKPGLIPARARTARLFGRRNRKGASEPAASRQAPGVTP